ncbi:hypothetical protein RIF29_04154 [Crotalaria pallida]|uniref:PGG domain-containing protein n=1 Tax=Crotalaria pallida TaxID=3830 RepID=A0AAN9J0X3_CROPI
MATIALVIQASFAGTFPVSKKMENAIIPNSTTPSSQAKVVQIASAQFGIELTTSSPASAQFRRPSLELIEDTSQFFNKCVPLYKIAALKGDWNAAKCMIDADNRLLKAAITKGWGTLLHAVAGTNHVHFVEELIKLLDPYDLELQDFNGNTAFCYAAASGNIQIAAMMINKNGCVPHIRGGEGMTPLYMAALQGRSDMAWYLYNRTTNIFEEEDWNTLFFICLENGLYDLALQMSQTKQRLAFIRNENNETGLHLLARKSSDFNCQRRWYLQNVISSSEKPTPILQLVQHLWSTLLDLHCAETEMRILISWPSQVIFDATEVGNFHFVAELMRSYPDLIWEVDHKNRSIIHIAVVHRHSSIFTLIHELSFIKDFIATFVDEEENNILHCAAKLAPSYRLNLISGAALQMTHELLWFEEVKKIMLQSQIEKKNSNGKTPYELFAQEHKELLTKAESWTKTTANNCILVSTVIAAGVFVATFNIPGGSNKNTGTPNYLQKSAFLIFAMSNATSLISSSASILIFLSILISSYAEDNYFKSLPFKLLFGLIAQFISITSMMIAFSASFFITYYHGLMWIPSFISVLAFLPVTLFAFLLFPLWSDIIYSSYFCLSLFRPSKHMLY